MKMKFKMMVYYTSLFAYLKHLIREKIDLLIMLTFIIS